MKGSQWWNQSWNIVHGCTPRSPGCAHCWARGMAYRLRGRYGYPTDNPFKLTIRPDRLNQPFHWRKPRRVFVCSMSDFLHPAVPFSFQCEAIQVMAKCPEHTFLILTKREEQLDLWEYNNGWPRMGNLWTGVSAENQEYVEKRVPVVTCLCRNFVSLEPLLGPVDLTPWLWKLDWVIAGCESGSQRRRADPDWFRAIRDQCVKFGVPFFLKQMEVDGTVEHLPELDGQRWDLVPQGMEVKP